MNIASPRCVRFFRHEDYDAVALEAALSSPEMGDAIEDVPNFATGGVTIMFCEYEDFPPRA